jgi:3-oxoadipate enol-lactonase
MPTIDANGVTTRYEEQGAGPAVVLVHGLGGTTALWQKVKPALAAEFRVVAYDLRGSGGSSRPPGAWAPDDFVADLDAIVRALGLAPAAIVGHSMAGGVALAYAAREPAQVRAVCGVGAVTELPDAGREGMRARAATVRADGMADVAVAVATAGTAPSWREAHPDEWDALRALLAANDPEAYALQAEAAAQLDLGSVLPGIGCPVLLVTGELDAPSPPALNEANAARIPRARYVQLADCAHLAPLEKPAELLDALLPFLREAS